MQSEPIQAFEDDAMEAAAAQALEAVDEQPIDIIPVNRGNRKETLLVRFVRRGPVVLQLCEQRSWLRTEARLLTEIRERTSVPVPPVLAAGTEAGVAYVLTAYVAGDDLHRRFAELKPDTRKQLAESFGRYLGELHDGFQFDGYGPLTMENRVGTEHGLGAENTDWGAWFQRYSTDALERLPAAFEPIRTTAEKLVREDSIDSDPGACLYPWDFRPGNVLVGDEQITAVLDWEAPLAAPPSLSVAKAEYLVADWYVSEPAPLRRAFKRGYERVRPYPTVPTAHRVAAIADSAVDSNGTVTNPGYPELGAEKSLAFHRGALEAVLESY